MPASGGMATIGQGKMAKSSACDVYVSLLPLFHASYRLISTQCFAFVHILSGLPESLAKPVDVKALRHRGLSPCQSKDRKSVV